MGEKPSALSEGVSLIDGLAASGVGSGADPGRRESRALETDVCRGSLT